MRLKNNPCVATIKTLAHGPSQDILLRIGGHESRTALMSRRCDCFCLPHLGRTSAVALSAPLDGWLVTRGKHAILSNGMLADGGATGRVLCHVGSCH